MMLTMAQPNFPHHESHHVPASSSPMVTLSTSSQPRLPGQLSHLKPPSRPRLSLNTTINNATHLRSFGKGSSLRLDTLSAVSPTARNTFSNAYQARPPPAAPSIESRPKLSISINPSIGHQEDFKSSSSDQSTRTPSSSSTSSAASTAASEQSGKDFYNLPKNVASILVNSPISRPVKMAAESQPALRSKQVSFRDPLDEEIRTQKYTLAHSDITSTEEEFNLESSSDSPDVTPTATSAPQLSTELIDEHTTMDLKMPSIPTTIQSSPPPRRHGRRGSSRGSPRVKLSTTTSSSTCTKRDSSSDEDSDDSYTQTPVAGRCKRRRDWTWTLDPLPGYRVEDGEGLKRESSVGSMDDDTLSISSRCTESSSN